MFPVCTLSTCMAVWHQLRYSDHGRALESGTGTTIGSYLGTGKSGPNGIITGSRTTLSAFCDLSLSNIA